MIDGFKKFISRGNMIDMAVGVVMGSAVTSVVNAIVDNLINPLIAMLFGKPDMSGLLAFTFNGATISFGAVLGALLNFLMIAVAVYFGVLMPINKLRDMSEALLVKARIKEAEDAKAAADAADKATKSAKAAEDAATKDAVKTADGTGTTAAPNGLPASPAGPSTADRQVVELLTEIRDQLAKRSAA
ncbi:large-conductance mechanosensitive channel [Bifidobacterium samirii]|uniref:Large-conductance mechanosensitive channel n=1 Tax=Bifidobacterium samirii TaxID=2306974 RepID=A0A430FV89_9BIFI|nr:large conductance mechanosensitive channel protein MscL [Bifidobacterium samirii]RSX57475.1 large-conductance mechanosensitive channel [Bifidobacterium samirii]